MDQCVSKAPIKRAMISEAESGDNPIIAAVAGKKLRVIFLALNSITAVTVRFESGTADGFLTGAMALGATSVFIWPENELGWIETVAGEALNMILGGNVQVSGVVGYQEVN